MQKTIDGLKAFLTPEECRKLKLTGVMTMMAIQQYKPENSAVFDAGSEEYTRDKTCEINFTMLNLAGRILNEADANRETLEATVNAIPLTIKELTDNLTLFLNSDQNEQRKEQYRKALDYMEKIGHLVADLQPENPRNGGNSMR